MLSLLKHVQSGSWCSRYNYYINFHSPRNNQGNNGGASGGTGTGGSGGQNAGQNAQPMNMEHMLFSFLNDLISGLSGGGGVTVGGGFP